MAIVDPIHMLVLRKVFPEINQIKIEVFTLFAYGMSIKDIAAFRGTSVQSVSKLLRELCELYQVASVDALKAVFATRLNLYTHISFHLEVASGDEM